MVSYKTVTINTDGGSRGNPGPAALGIAITADGQEVAGFGRTLGVTTNNVAEYKAVDVALGWVLQNKECFSKESKIAFKLDSQLVCMQLTGVYKIKNQLLASIAQEIQKKRQEIKSFTFSDITFSHVPRAQNKRADYFVNQALDNELKLL